MTEIMVSVSFGWRIKFLPWEYKFFRKHDTNPKGRKWVYTDHSEFFFDGVLPKEIIILNKILLMEKDFDYPKNLCR